MKGRVPVPAEPGVDAGYDTGLKLFEVTCLGWPHNMPGRSTGGCCIQWVDDGD